MIKVERQYGADPESYLVGFDAPVRCRARAYLFRRNPVTPKGGPQVSVDVYFDEPGIRWVESLADKRAAEVFAALAEALELEDVPVSFMVNFGRPADRVMLLSLNCEKEPPVG